MKVCLQEEVSGASDLVDQLQAALKQAKASNSNSSAELVAGLQSELERQAGVIGELRTQLRTSTEAQEDLRRQTVSLVEAQAHMAQHMDSIVEGPPAAVARMQAHLLEKVTLPLLWHLSAHGDFSSSPGGNCLFLCLGVLLSAPSLPVVLGTGLLCHRVGALWF